MENLKKLYDALIKLLEEAEVPCTVNLIQTEIIVETGRDASELLDDTIVELSQKVGLDWGKNVSACADMSGFNVIESERISGNKKKYRN